MRLSNFLRSGDPPMEFPKRVWTPVGGWYATNPNWRRNTLIAGGALVFIAACIIRQSWKYERRPVPGVRPILSQRFAAHTLEDDPQYYDKVSYYKKNGKSFFQRVFPNKEDMEE